MAKKGMTVGELEKLLADVENKKLSIVVIADDTDRYLSEDLVGVEKAKWNKDKTKIIVGSKSELFLIG